MVFFEFSVAIGFSLFALGLLVGTIAPTFGIGGGLLNVPLLLLIYSNVLELDTFTATSTSLGIIFFTALSGTLSYAREKRIDYRIAFSFVLFAVPGAIAGSTLSKWLSEKKYKIDTLQIIFAVTMITIALYKITTIFVAKYKKNNNNEEIIKKEEIQEDRPWWKQTVLVREITDRHGNVHKYKAKLVPGVFIAVLGGFVGGMLGLGGGVVFMPILTMALGIPAGIAAATSTLTILIANPFAIGTRIFSSGWGTVRWDIVIIWALGTVIAANIVPRYIHKIKSEWILSGFWLLAVVAAIRLLIKVLTGIAI
ncbi:MAG: sulfite exporter TauE/SafE family protein [Asgard group archaeon]|nr:sulfite exporter TauE/SafE family protein [Asgard group archaeon]